MRPIERARNLLQDAASLKITIVLLAGLMALVTACTLAQVSLGTFAAVRVYIRSFLVFWTVPGLEWRLPVFPGGAAIGGLLFLNLLASLFTRLDFSVRKIGLWLAHAGILLLVAGEFVTGIHQVESQMVIEEGQTVNFTESRRDAELVLIDASDPAFDRIVSVPLSLLKRASGVALPSTPFTLTTKRFYTNASLSPRPEETAPGAAPEGMKGFGQESVIWEKAPVSSDEEVNLPAALVELSAGGSPLGTWTVSAEMDQSQTVEHEGKNYSLALRFRRHLLPFSLTLLDFSHDVYPGTDIPKNFSSRVRLVDPERNEDREVLIWMNHPLRHRGLSFYQASYGKNDTLSVLQVVQNPGRLIPYLSCILVFLGLLFHFGLSLWEHKKPAA